MKKYILIVPVLLIMFSCKEGSTDSKYEINVPDLYESLFGIPITEDVRVFDFSTKKIRFSETTTWMAFDVTENRWLAMKKDFNLTLFGNNSLPFSVVGERTDLETGFEGYLDNDYESYGSDVRTIRGRFYVREMNGYFRIVYLIM